MQRRALLVTIIILLLLSACTPSQPRPSAASTGEWRYTHLRALDPADAAQPELDVIALYTRYTRHDLQIRLDILDLPETAHPDIYIALDLVPGGDVELPIDAKTSRPWDILITIPSDGPPTLSENQYPISNTPRAYPTSNIQLPCLPIPRVLRDPLLDTLTINLNANLLPKQTGVFHIQVFTTEPGSPIVADSTVMISSEAQSLGRAPLLISFWNALPAHTPAQALRRWDGAHTGPMGRRHGLKHLIEAVESHRVPITLLDLKSPLSLSTLEILDATPQVKELAADGLVIIPDTLPARYFGELPSWANQKAAAISRETAINFGLQGSQLLYIHDQQPGQLTPYALSLVLQPTGAEAVPQTHMYRSGDQSILPIPLRNYDAVQITAEGLDLSIKKALLAAAIAAEASSDTAITVLGGDLPHTPWGNPLIVDSAMLYIAAHPWIQPLSEADLLTYGRITGYEPPIQQTTSQQHEAVLGTLAKAPPSPITDLAWEAYLALLAPADPAYSELSNLRAQYLGVIGDLLAAARWDVGAGVQPVYDCSLDTDFDGRLECILTSEGIFVLIDPQGARLKLLFVQGDNGVHQIVGGSSQFAVGLSDPYTWDLTRGSLADPDVIPGAFAGPWEPFNVTQLANGLRFTSPTVQKDFTLTENGLRVAYQINAPLQVQIPLAVAPETRFSPGWGERYFGEDTPQGWAWGIEAGPRVLVQTSGALTTQTFADDLPALSVPEDPNYNYPPGHFIPIPLGIVTIQAEDDFWVELSIP